MRSLVFNASVLGLLVFGGLAFVDSSWAFAGVLISFGGIAFSGDAAAPHESWVGNGELVPLNKRSLRFDQRRGW